MMSPHLDHKTAGLQPQWSLEQSGREIIIDALGNGTGGTERKEARG